MQWIIAYDIKEDKARRKACRLLRRFSGGYQYSGFEIVHEARSPTELLKNLSELIAEHDRLLLVKNSGIGPDWHLGVGYRSSKKELIVFV